MQSPINKYGNIEVIADEVVYSIPLAYMQLDDVADIEEHYKHKGHSLKDANNYLFAHDITMVTNRVMFTYYLENIKSFYYLRQLYFEDQMYYFRSFIELAKHNDEDVRILWDKNNFFVDLTDGTVKALVFEFEGHKLYNLPTTLDGLKEIVLLSLTTLHRVLGKPRIIDFIDQRDLVIRFAEQVLRASTISDVERVLEEHITNYEREEDSKREREAYLKGLPFWKRQKEIMAEKKKEKKKEAATNKLIGPYAAASYAGGKKGLRSVDDLSAPTAKRNKEGNSQKFTDSKFFYLGTAAIAVLLLMYIGFSSAIEKREAQAQELQQQQEAQGLSTDQLAEVYRLSMANESEAALEILETIEYAQLPEAEQKLTLKLYEKTGQYQKAIELNPEYADTVVKNLVAGKKMEELKELQKEVPDSSFINYELAFQEQNYEEVISIAQDIEMSNRRKKQLVLSYLWNDLNKEAKTLLSAEEDADLAKELKKIMADFNAQTEKIKNLNTKIEAAEKDGNSARVKNLRAALTKLATTLNTI